MSYLTRLNLLKEKIIEFYDKEDDRDNNIISDDNDDESSSSSSLTQFYNHIILIYKNITYNYDICMELEISFREVLKNNIMIKDSITTTTTSDLTTSVVSDEVCCYYY